MNNYIDLMANELPQSGVPGANQPGNQQQKDPSQPKTRQQYSVPFRKVGANQQGMTYKPLGKGTLVIAKYDFWKHDPYPLILVNVK